MEKVILLILYFFLQCVKLILTRHTDSDYGLLCLCDQDIVLMVGVTGPQEMACLLILGNWYVVETVDFDLLFK